MTLSDFLTEAQLTHAEFGRKIQTTQATVSRYANGSRVPRPAVMARIQAVTGGRVTPNDFIPFKPKLPDAAREEAA